MEQLPSVAAAAAAAPAGELSKATIEALCAEAASSASEMLYELSGRIFTGGCGPVKVRPVSRPTDMDSRSWVGSLMALVSGNMAMEGRPGVAAHYGKETPPTVDLGVTPVTEVIQVKIDGLVIPPVEYELRKFRYLVRLRPAAGYQPTARYGWPTSQVADLPDDEPGTFSVEYRYGQPPPPSGALAAKKLAEFMVLPLLGDNSKFPRRVTSVSRQGVSTATTDIMELLRQGSLGIWEVEAFLLAHNPHRLQRPSAVFSPDLGRTRRVTPT